MDTVTLYRPVGPQELALIKESDWREFPPRLPNQPIFYPVTNQAYAAQIARDWNVKASGAGFVLRFAVKASYLKRFPVQTVGGAMRILWGRLRSSKNLRIDDGDETPQSVLGAGAARLGSARGRLSCHGAKCG